MANQKPAQQLVVIRPAIVEERVFAFEMSLVLDEFAQRRKLPAIDTMHRVFAHVRHLFRDALAARYMSESSGAGFAFFGSGLSPTTASVVRNIAATEAAFCSAVRVTFAGSTMPLSTMFTHSSVAAL